MERETRRLVLASGSPRRRELLSKMGYRFEIRKPDVDENTAGDAKSAVAELARRKANACREEENALIIASDTLVSLDGVPLGKPRDEAEAVLMLSALSGCEHDVYTGVCMLDTVTGDSLTRVARTGVRFRPLTREEICAYVSTGEPMDKAGAYAIQGGAGAFVEAYNGDFDNVVGFPTRVVSEMLEAFRFRK